MVRGSAEALDFYVSQAKVAFLTVLEQTCNHLTDLSTLAYVGFTTDLGCFRAPQAQEVYSRVLEDEDHLAERAVSLVRAVLLYRCSSMSWHCDSWPGLLGLFASSVAQDQAKGLARLRRDWAAYKAARDLGGVSPFLGKLCKKSPFAGLVVREVA
eukprot:6465865-Lingulodinium_polyedra.AAC.1